jgi:high-affinity Fe2+/Pb2+ permease
MSGYAGGYLTDHVNVFEECHMIGIVIAILLAALVYWLCVALGLPAIIAIIAAVLVLVSGVGTGGYGYGTRFGGRRGL